MTIKFIKLKSGEDIVSEIEESGKTITLKVPARVITIRTSEVETPKMMVELFLPHIKGFSGTIQKSDILLIEEVGPSLKTYYTENILSMIPTL